MTPNRGLHVMEPVHFQKTQFKQHRTNLKRASGQISCAECRRLKLRCDKKVPCFTCTKRGCSNICPLGTLISNNVKVNEERPVTDDVDDLQAKISDMSQRIHQLEDALRHECDLHMGELHPLLKDPTSSDVEPEEEFDLKETMGLLTLSEGSSSRLIGTSGSEAALLAEAGITGNLLTDDGKPQLPLPSKIQQASELWPFEVFRLPSDDDVFLALLEVYLPSRERASGLVEAYLQNLSWYIQPITREQIVGELIPMAYGVEKGAIVAHDLALLFMIFAMGSSADLTLPPANQEGDSYRQLARAALSINSVFEEHSLSAVQTVVLLACYEVTSGRRNGSDYAWKMMNLAMGLSSTMLLYSDKSRLDEDPKITQRRRLLFWELCAVDGWQSLCMGRPAAFRPDRVDCEFPKDPESLDQDVDPRSPSLWNLKYRFAKYVLGPLTDTLCSGRAFKYSDILKLDKLVRNFDRSHLDKGAASWDPGDSQPFAREALLNALSELALMYIHRGHYARALVDYPDNPLRSPYAPSFLAAYRSAAALLRGLREKFSKVSDVFFRHWPMWASMLCAAVIVASVVTKNPDMRLAPSAVEELRRTIEVFTLASEQPVVREVLPILSRMYKKAKHALDEARSTRTNNVSAADDAIGDADSSRLLDILRGTTRVVRERPSVKLSAEGNRSQTMDSGRLRQEATTCHSISLHDDLPIPSSASVGYVKDELPTFHPQMFVGSSLNTPPWNEGNGVVNSNVESIESFPPPSSFEFPYTSHFGSLTNLMTTQNVFADNSSTATSRSTPDFDSYISSYCPDSIILPTVPLSTAIPYPDYSIHPTQGDYMPGPLFQDSQQAEEFWQTFVVQSGFTTEDEMMRLWGISQS